MPIEPEASPSSGLPRVAVVAHAVTDGGGQERVTAEVIRRSCERWDYHVVAAELAEDLRDRVVWHRVPVFERPFALRFAWFYAMAGVRLRALSTDLVHSVGAIVPNRVDLAAVHYCWAAAEEVDARPSPSPSARARRWAQRLTARTAVAAERHTFQPARTRLLAGVSDHTVRDLARHYPGVATTVIPNGVDTDRFRPDAGARSRIRSELGTEPDTFVVLFVGGDWLSKGLDRLIDATGSLVQAGDARVELWVAGEYDAAWARQAASRAGLGTRLRLLGFRDDIEAIHASADVLVHPSRYETFSLVVLEAAACGLPVVGTATSVRASLGVDRRDSLVVGTTTDITTVLRRLVVDSGERRSIGEQNRAIAETMSWDRTVAATERVYRDLLASSPAS